MSRIVWHEVGTREYEYGIDRAVFYPRGLPGVPWNGLIAVSEAPSGNASKKLYLDGVARGQKMEQSEFLATVQAIDYPDVLDDHEGLGGFSSATPFDLVYRTMVGSDIEVVLGYKIHLVYNARVAPIARSLSSINNTPSTTPFDWKLSAIPVRVRGAAPTAHLVIDSRTTDPRLLNRVEDLLYGTEIEEPHLPRPEVLADILDTDLLFINHRPDGLSRLTPEEVWDLEGKLSVGLYKRSAGSRLTETSTPGLYILE